MTPNGMTRQIDWDAQPLGKVSDVALAADLGCSRKVIVKERIKRGIAPYSIALDIDWDSIPYGTKTDNDLAIEYGCSQCTIRGQRIKRGIKPYGNTYKKGAHHGSISVKERIKMARLKNNKCSVPGCNKKVCVDLRLKNPENLCRDHLMPDDYDEMRNEHLGGWTTSMLGHQ